MKRDQLLLLTLKALHAKCQTAYGCSEWAPAHLLMTMIRLRGTAMTVLVPFPSLHTTSSLLRELGRKSHAGGSGRGRPRAGRACGCEPRAQLSGVGKVATTLTALLPPRTARERERERERFIERERERERERFIRNNLHNGVVSGAAR